MDDSENQDELWVAVWPLPRTSKRRRDLTQNGCLF